MHPTSAPERAKKRAKTAAVEKVNTRDPDEVQMKIADVLLCLIERRLLRDLA